MSEAREKPLCQCGRAWRHRRRRRRAREEGKAPSVVDADAVFVHLNRWLRGKGRCFSHTQLRPALFADTGRGLMAARAVHAGDVLISIPKEVLITTSTVMEEEVLRKALLGSHSKFRAMDVLTFFLLYQKYLEEQSHWKAYLDSLPVEYSVPAYCSLEEADTLPEVLKIHKLNQDDNVNQCYLNIRTMISESADLKPIFHPLSVEDVRWGWFTVNTRAVYLKNNTPPSVVAGKDVYALAPYLDLLNHTHTAQVMAGLNNGNNCYEIVTQVPYSPHEQVFINYGPHDNLKLCVEYGFILPDNPHSHMPVTLQEVVEVAQLVMGENSSDMNNKVALIQAHDLDENLGVNAEGLSWSLEAAFAICLMSTQQLAQGWQLVCQDLHGVGHRLRVVRCLQNLVQHKTQKLEECLQQMSEFSQSSAALSVAKALVEEFLIILKGARTDIVDTCGAGKKGRVH